MEDRYARRVICVANGQEHDESANPRDFGGTTRYDPDFSAARVATTGEIRSFRYSPQRGGVGQIRLKEFPTEILLEIP